MLHREEWVVKMSSNFDHSTHTPTFAWEKNLLLSWKFGFFIDFGIHTLQIVVYSTRKSVFWNSSRDKEKNLVTQMRKRFLFSNLPMKFLKYFSCISYESFLYFSLPTTETKKIFIPWNLKKVFCEHYRHLKRKGWFL